MNKKLIIAVIGLSIVIFGLLSTTMLPVKLPQNKLRLNVTDWWWSERISTLLRLNSGVHVDFIELNGEEFVRIVNEKLNEGDVYVWSNGAFTTNFVSGSTIKSIRYAGESFSNIMWYFEETKILIPDEEGGGFMKTETFTVYYARGVIPEHK